MAKFDFHSYARRGAEARIAELKAELEGIYGAFPDLTGRRGPRRRASAVSNTDDGQTVGPDDTVTRRRRRRKPMTADQKKAVGERMRQYWAARKAAAKK